MTEDPTRAPAGPQSARRRSFGEVAEAYDAARPDYPDQLVAGVVEFADLREAPALEVGAGTGKATRAFAVHGLTMTCIEPDQRMAGVLSRTCAGLPGVTVETGEFETRQPDHRYGLLFSGQAWHWPSTALVLLDPAGHPFRISTLVRGRPANQ
ncbi:class I SAM-dependent methyltransferase [Streptoverticillium reticulum]|uniref:class I SAM-dependent methyltransferase n=1 Tax=Streptoverticillium reticulum TaxID=1433415 RepID=UPI0039BF7E4F